MDESKLMTPEDFEGHKDKLKRLSSQTIDLARMILVDGIPNAEAARQTGMARQNVKRQMNRVMARLAGYPEGWVRFDGWMPADFVAKIKEAEKAMVDRGEDDGEK
jgi:DNA-directed RNA polymerase specialized sigma24 family protein